MALGRKHWEVIALAFLNNILYIIYYIFKKKIAIFIVNELIPYVFSMALGRKHWEVMALAFLNNIFNAKIAIFIVNESALSDIAPSSLIACLQMAACTLPNYQELFQFPCEICVSFG